MKPLGMTRIEQIENAEGPPPLGSTATKKCCTLRLWSLSYQMRGWSARFSNSSMSSLRKHFCEPSAEMPSVSLSSMACNSRNEVEHR